MRFLPALGLAVLPLTSCSISTPPLTTPRQPFHQPEKEQGTPLLVFSHGHHTGLVLPRKALESELPEVTTRLTGKWLEFGWGDEGFYRSNKVTIPLALRALAYFTPSVMHVATSNRPLHLDYAFAPAHLFYLTEEQKETLVRRLSNQFKRDEEGQLLNLGPGRYGESQFYRARDYFYFPKTCNAWTASHLRAIGYQVHAVTAPGLFHDLARLEQKSPPEVSFQTKETQISPQSLRSPTVHKTTPRFRDQPNPQL